MLAAISRLAARTGAPAGSEPRKRAAQFATTRRAPFAFREPRLPAPLPAIRSFHSLAPAQAKARSPHVKELEQPLRRFRDAITRAEREQFAHQLRRATESLLSRVYHEFGDVKDPGQEKLKAWIGEHFRLLDREALDCLQQGLRQANLSISLVRSEVGDVMLRDYGFANGPPHRKSVTELDTDQFFDLLDQIQQEES